jgi:hypothetical protein
LSFTISTKLRSPPKRREDESLLIPFWNLPQLFLLALVDSAHHALQHHEMGYRAGSPKMRAIAGQFALLLCLSAGLHAQTAEAPHTTRTRHFLAGRTLADGSGSAAALARARAEHLQMQLPASPVGPRANPLNATWQPIGPNQVASQSYGNVTGRVTAIAIDPADATGNTVYLGTTGGGVWKSINAAGPAASVLFTALTDTLPVFSANAGTPVIPSLSIGAIGVAPVGGGGVILAGTGDPNDATDSYYGEGILRSTDGGATWTLAQTSTDGVAGNHSFTGLGIAGFAWSTATPTLVVAAASQAAESVLVNGITAASVLGLYFSADSGVTWQMATILDGAQIVQQPMTPGPGIPGNAVTAVVWNAARQRFYAAIRFHGYYESTDGRTWTRLAHQPGPALTATACPANPGGTGSPACPIFRGALAVQPLTGDTFALTVDRNNLDQGLWQDVCALTGASCAATSIAFAKQLASTPLEVGSGSTVIPQGDYNLALAAVPSGTTGTPDTTLFAGTVDLFRCSLAAGCVLRNTTNAVNGCAAPAHVVPAQHAIAALALPVLYLGNDGGLWRSTDGVDQQQTPCSADDASHFQDLNSALGSLAEIVSFAQDPADPAVLLAGLGANGTAATSLAPSTTPWPQISPGEGDTVAIDPTSPRNWYVSTAAGVNVRFCPSGSACAAASFTGSPTLGYPQVANDASLIHPPFLLDPALPTDVLIGTCRVWRGPAQSGATWPGSNAIGAPLGGPANSTCSATTNPSIRSLAAAGPPSSATAAQNAGSTVLYAGLAGTLDGGLTLGGHLFANYAANFASSTTAWLDLARSTVTNDSGNAGLFNPGAFDISSIAADPHDATGETVYATVMGFTNVGISTPHLYRSIDGGGHWTNISSNLPNAPANAVLVDPNDANTLYVALDTGVYTTTTVATCTASNCWSIYGVSLPNAPVTALSAAPGIPTGDGRLGELRAATYGRGLWQIALLTAAPPAAPAITLSPTSYTFSTQAVGTSSSAQVFLVTNTGNAPLIVSQVATTGDFASTSNCIGPSVAPGSSCTVQVSFVPAAVGTRNGLLTVYANVAGGQAVASLSGTGAQAAAILLNPLTLSFAATNVGATSAIQNITLSNTGGVTATLQTPTVTGDFAIAANTCGPTLGPSTGCTVSIAFGPTASGTRTGIFTIIDSAGTQTASLTGIGQSPATDALTPLSLSFAPQVLNTASTAQHVTLTNSGDVALTLIAATLSAGDFTVTNQCGNSLNPHAGCSFAVAFVPNTVGPGTGTLTVTDQFRSQTVLLSGIGVAPAGVSLSPASSLAFAATGVGLATTAQTVTLTNNGGLPLAVQTAAVTGDFTLTNGCPASLAPGAACTLQIVFAPTAAGPRTGTFTLADSAANSPQTLALTGTGIDFTLTSNGSTTATISAGKSAVYPLLLTALAGLPGTVAFTCAGVPLHATCTVTPATPALGGITPITVTIATSVLGAALDAPAGPWTPARLWLATLLPLGLLALRRPARRLPVCAALCLLLAITGCAASRIIPEPAAATGPVAVPTPTGTYNLVITGTSASLTRPVNLTLIVQ